MIIQKTTRLIISKVPRRTVSNYNKKIGFLTTNKTITKVNILKRKIKRVTSPVTARLKFFLRVLKQNTTKKFLTSPIFIGSIVLIVAAGFGLSFYKTNRAEKIENFDIAKAAVDQVTNNINVIDSHLIVGREGDALRIHQESVALLATITGIEEFNDDRERLSLELGKRQARLRKEVLILNSTVIVADLPGLLGSAPVLMTNFEKNLFIVGENPRTVVKVNTSDGSSEKITITTDVNQIQSAVSIDQNRMIWLGNNTVTTVDLATGEASGLVSNIENRLQATEFFNNRFYSLSETDSQIMRSNRDPNFAVLKPWITQDGLNLANLRDLAIDVCLCPGVASSNPNTVIG